MFRGRKQARERARLLEGVPRFNVYTSKSQVAASLWDYGEDHLADRALLMSHLAGRRSYRNRLTAASGPWPAHTLMSTSGARIFVMGVLTYRSATLEDVPLLVSWHADPEVSRYWGDRTFTDKQMCDRLEREAVDAWMVEEDGVPVGYLQSWREDDPPKRGGLDGFLIPDVRGRGVMPFVARRLAERLLEDGWEYVTVDPEVWNERAIRGWQKAGFVEVSRDEKTVLLRFATTAAPG